ncbi:probable CCR4-associated factor 1 homolog 9 [Sorghum bicolor]|uniref:probable CCR4-associated factor 1 homolog 9 n=1 Tax=Sorghum bicolor TaxID=4558 RepID=UPI000B4243F0|nr:probable CCR4-associated factor 1 homolog 9 [Sorghum bicolor]|eukprot:XP_021301859.1 probable CCR4-associated factor 1 homolog 9 [Sorghum bicolor]
MLPHRHLPRPWRNAAAAPPMVLYQPPPPPPPMFLYPPPYPTTIVGVPPPYPAVPHPPYFGHHHPMMPPAAVHVQLQSVTAANFAAELDVIGSLLQNYPYVVVDTEYPGTVHHAPAGRRDSDLSPDERYALVKANVDELPIVQLGITLCDAHGNLPFVPDFDPYGYHHTGGGYGAERAWEVNFSDFDVSRDRHAPQSVAFLRSQGVDFDAARARGVSSASFGAKLAEILSTAAAPRSGNGVELTWVTFGGAYDLAYLVKMLDGGEKPLPETRQGFVERLRELLGGGRLFDAKFMAENCGRADLRGVGMRSVAANLGAAMPAEDLPWLAGTKSVTAYSIHSILRLHVLSQDTAAGFEGIIDGLQ